MTLAAATFASDRSRVLTQAVAARRLGLGSSDLKSITRASQPTRLAPAQRALCHPRGWQAVGVVGAFRAVVPFLAFASRRR